MELVQRLQNEGHSVLVYDFISAKIYDPLTETTSYLNSYWWAPWVLKLKYIRRLFIPIINRKCISKEFKPGDVVSVHYVHEEYSLYAEQIKQQGCRLITTFWGSDYFRATDKQKIAYQPLLMYSDLITMVEGVQSIFKEEYPEYKHKIRTTYFGLKLLDVIKNVKEEDIALFKQKYQIPSNKIIISIGYNGIPEQQHYKLIEAIKSLKDEHKSAAHLFVPLTYGGTLEYKGQVKALAKELGLSVTFFETRLTDIELATMRCASDVVVNIQKTDAFSGALSESLVAGNIVIVGDWLPYDVYDQWGVKVIRTDEDSVALHLNNVLECINGLEETCEKNKQLVLGRLTWDSTLKLWIKVYENLN
ncbi:glycosyltransferase involved in cell wall biosynthesis [Pontibacter aydingkolensis]|uniref:Uncharacterized protein n=1 Tax=Pontibacter aydingkolensis TaxID=1911536 RepID=A0ABS7CUY5_9BACT|nr:hypothetical protein [Pontibacter aydingkolensis]MBW7467674.1 hypothetical protein [Pontibacter aydingkolensis]